eukprot:TRINITY_DN36078_c0_g1_i1.p1 TRINITY_DN36078_c0_g1~~TRINITY_DN36078_c0_g1_i1.p1  ORF type:complete len:287 (-),score=50.12 TRINITY_DN36078_c0_g1_i1:34-894(-)
MAASRHKHAQFAVAVLIACVGVTNRLPRLFSAMPNMRGSKNSRSGSIAFCCQQRFAPVGKSPSGRAAVVLPDHAAAALGFFGNLRIAASLLTGAALGGLGAFSSQDKGNKSRLEETAFALQIFGTVLTVTQCITVIFLCTVCTSNIISGAIDTHASSAHALLTGALEMEYLTCRALFLTSLLIFLFATAAKLVAASAKAEGNKKMIGYGSACLLLSGMCWQAAYANQCIASGTPYGNLGGLYCRALLLWLQHLGPFTGITAFVCWTLAGTGFVLLGLALQRSLRGP